MAYGDAIKREEEQAYRQHNVTRTATRGDGSLVRRPVNPHQQCDCEKCRGHRRRNAVTGTASERKDV